MENERIRELADSWKTITEHVLSYEDIDRKVLSNLFLDTYLLIKKYSAETMIPRELYRVLWEMNDFNWWAIHSVETPIHSLHQEITSLVIDFNYFVVHGRTNELEIKYRIAKIEGEL